MPISTRTFRVFVSSTFSDLVAERDALRTRVYPRLAALCEAHSASFQAVDLRWGVSKQASESQRTMRICLREIDRCREMTTRPNFILLIGDRYGWRPFDLPDNAHIVVSCLPRVCLEALQAKLPPEQLLELDPMPRNDAEVLLDRWLAEAGRDLQREQRKIVLDAFRRNRLPLYLRLLYEQARTWPSSLKPVKPAEDIPGIIRETFSALSGAGRHGPVLVKRSLAYIAAGKAGLSHEELIEVLSNDRQVMADFCRRSPDSPATDALPAIIWSRLFLDLAPYLTDRLSDGTPVLDFLHRQLREVVQQDYLSAGQKTRRHQALSRYFANQEMFVAADGKQSANLRKLVEWPFQLSGARDWRRLSQVLGDFEFLAAKVAALGTEAVIEDFDLIGKAADDAPADVDIEALQTLEACLRLSSGVLSQDAGQLPAQLHGRLADKKNRS
jgi:hypothetical protein